jgi:predicted glycogen debranching enzyme
MDNLHSIKQYPAPGTRLLRFRGDTETFILSLPKKEKGSAWIRTNIGHAAILRKDIIRKVIHDVSPLGRDWFDIPMKRVNDLKFQVTLPLCEAGHFEAKCFFLKKGETNPKWPGGYNIVINVKPARICCANIIYNAFVRQFGPNKSGGRSDLFKKPCIEDLDSEGYTVIPPSGTFRDLIGELDFIIGELGCRILQLLPVHPTPTTYARMGRFGSPFAALSFTAVDPAQTEFDPKATPLEQFIELVDAVHERNARIIIDIAINHTGWGARLHETHPEWLIRNQDGRIEVPGAWGVRWEDLTSLDYTNKELWQYMADIFLTWCRRGVDGFRCDAGYMVPVPVWEYIVARIREQYPNTIFFLEGLGGKISVTRDILNKADFDWAYSELFQNYDRSQIESYLPETMKISGSDGIMVHFSETHDNKRLAARSKTYAKMRTALCALCSHNGAFGFANGVEWYATEKINVHDSPSLNWGAYPNQVDHIRRLNDLLRNHPAFFDQTEIKMIRKGKGNFIALLRHYLPYDKKLLILINIDIENHTLASWDSQETGMKVPVFVDLITEEEITTNAFEGQPSYLLDPGQVLCLSADRDDLTLLSRSEERVYSLPKQIEKQCLRAKALDVLCFYRGIHDLEDFDPDQAAQQLANDPIEYCHSLNSYSMEPRVITWQWPRDKKREVMIPPDHFLMVCADTSFRVRIIQGDKVVANEESLQRADGTFFALFSPLPPPANHCVHILKLSVYTPGYCRHIDAPLLFLSRAENARVKKTFYRTELLRKSLILLGTNGRGSMLRANAYWGELKSRYDALLAANMHHEYLEDRWIMFTRCRAWLVFQGYSQEIRFDCLNLFSFGYNSIGSWQYHIPTGQGEHIQFTIRIEMINRENAIRMVFFRHPGDGSAGKLDDAKEVKLILRPDIEDRNFHETTKAYLGAEHVFPESVTVCPEGFTFVPDPGRRLQVQVVRGTFVHEPEWHYMVYRSLEAERGLDPNSDLFSPGYFYSLLKGGESEELTACILGLQDRAPLFHDISIQDVKTFDFDDKSGWKPDEAMKQALNHFVVKREKLKSVIAGYPWFLDWGRDSLIVVRGLIAAGRTEDSRKILKQFGLFEKDGTLPNMICGKDTANRDTSDAPMWFFTACSDLIRAEGNDDFLDTPCDGRTIRQILISMGRSIIAGTPNGIRMDPESGLIFSPAHFTWMDTNHPAGTLRQGYPIEIQALWYAALSFLAGIDPQETDDSWEKMAEQVQISILDLFILEEEGYLSDCLHAGSGEPARQAEIDDALRPNQLFAVTLGAVTDTTICRNIVIACEELLVPGAIRSLADRPVRCPLKIVHHGKALNDPYHPYQERYAGDEDTKRKPAYHNGTAWTWVFPTFCEAWVVAYGDKGKETAMAWLASCVGLMNQGCAGHIPEILDADFPHVQRGCDAQAWGVSELLRVWKQIAPGNVA